MKTFERRRLRWIESPVRYLGTEVAIEIAEKIDNLIADQFLRFPTQLVALDAPPIATMSTSARDRRRFKAKTYEAADIRKWHEGALAASHHVSCGTKTEYERTLSKRRE